MTNLPFGFGPAGDDSSDKPGEPTGPAGFDMSQLGAMLSQLGSMMSSAGPSSGPVNYDLAKQIAIQQIPQSHPASSVDVQAVRDAVALAEVWLDGATTLPPGARTVTAWNAREWVEQTMPMWEKLCTPIADRVSNAWVEGLPEEAREQAGPLLAMMGSMGGMAFGSHLGGALAKLAGEVMTSTDIGFPLGPVGTAALLPRAVAEFGTGLGIGDDQVRLYLAAREAAHHRLYGHVPWLRERVLALVLDYASGIEVDFSAAEDLAEKLDLSNLTDLSAIQGALGPDMFTPRVTPGQRDAMERLETLLALVEGWVDTVVAEAIGNRLPGAAALRETLRRRRATGGPAEQTFASLIGLELRPRRLRASADLWRDLGAGRGVEGRDTLWSDPDLLPRSADLDDPAGFVTRDREFNDLLAGLSAISGPDDFVEALDQESDGPKPENHDGTKAVTNDSDAPGDRPGEEGEPPSKNIRDV